MLKKIGLQFALFTLLLGAVSFLVLSFNFISYLVFRDTTLPENDLLQFRMRITAPDLKKELGKGKIITTNAEGFRKPRWHRAHLPTEVQDKTVIWFFGGSTTFSVGLDDNETLPALLERSLPADWKPYVVNFGQSAYGMHQEVYLLVEALIKGQRPHYVIFYDGFNEEADFRNRVHDGIYTEFVETDVGWPNVHGAYEQFARQSNQRFWWIEHWPMMRWTKWLTEPPRIWMRNKLYKMGRYTHPVPSAAYVDQFTGAVTKRYFQSVAFIEQLSKAFGFHYLIFWQPSGAFLTSERCYIKPLGGAATYVRKTYWRETKNFYHVLYRKIVSNADNKNFPVIYIGDLFNSGQCEDKAYFTDYVHLNADGNRIVADKIAGIMKSFRNQGHIIDDRRYWALPETIPREPM